MSAPIEYLEAARVRDVAIELAQQGYAVRVATENPAQPYDIVATKPGKRVAIQVKARSTLGAETARLRKQAVEEGYDEFRLVLVNPPREIDVEVTALADKLHHYLLENVPKEIDALSSRTCITGVGDLEIGSVKIQPGKVRVVGSGAVEVLLECGGGSERDGTEWETDFPLEFDVTLDQDLAITTAALRVDTSTFYE